MDLTLLILFFVSSLAFFSFQYMEIKKLDAQLEHGKLLISYLERFVEFCKCGNPKGDCICGE